MNSKYLKLQVSILVILFIALSACNKLDEKPRQSLVVPTTLVDFQGMLDKTTTYNNNFNSLGEISSDNYFITDANFNSLSVIQSRNAYIWAKKTFEGVIFEPDWDYSYEKVFYSNIILEGLEKLNPNQNQAQFDNVKGQALFHRANAFLMLSQIFAKPYNLATASTDLGIPLRLSSDLNVKSTRATLQQTYQQIEADLLQAAPLLPVSAMYKTRPSKAAAFALLSRFYLIKGDYANSYLYADRCLQLNSTLLNYNSLNQTAAFPFPLFNNEVIFHGTLTNTIILLPSRLLIEPTLYDQYNANDLRRTLFFNGVGSYAFKGSYNGAGIPLFGGIATDEMYLTRAECHARLNRPSEAMKDLNDLLATRYRIGTFSPLTASAADDALTKVLIERRKQLLLRGLRWSDVRRLNTNSRFATTLTRTVAGNTYTLPPNDSRYTFPIPDYILAFAEMQQNP